MDEEKSIPNSHAALWEIVRNELMKENSSADKVAVLETEKIFKKVLKEKDLPGKSTEDQIKNYENLFSDPDKLKYSRAMFKKLMNKPGFAISREDAREIIKGYREAAMDLEKIDFADFSLKDRISLFLKRNFYGFPQKTKKIVLAILTISVVTFILTETESGRSISSFLLSVNNYFFYKIIPAILILIALIVILIGALYAYQNKKK